MCEITWFSLWSRKDWILRSSTFFFPLFLGVPDKRCFVWIQDFIIPIEYILRHISKQALIQDWYGVIEWPRGSLPEPRPIGKPPSQTARTSLLRTRSPSAAKGETPPPAPTLHHPPSSAPVCTRQPWQAWPRIRSRAGRWGRGRGRHWIWRRRRWRRRWRSRPGRRRRWGGRRRRRWEERWRRRRSGRRGRGEPTAYIELWASGLRDRLRGGRLGPWPWRWWWFHPAWHREPVVWKRFWRRRSRYDCRSLRLGLPLKWLRKPYFWASSESQSLCRLDTRFLTPLSRLQGPPPNDWFLFLFLF